MGINAATEMEIRESIPFFGIGDEPEPEYDPFEFKTGYINH